MSSNKWNWAISLIWATSLLGMAASSREASAEKPVILERGPNHRIVRHVSWQTNATGQLAARTNTYTELAVGMHFKNERGEWEESQAKIEILPDNAGAIAAKGAHKAIFPVEIKAGLIELQTSERKWLRSRVWGIAYYDSSDGKSVLLAEVKESEGQLLGDNTVQYPDAFSDFVADVRYTYTRAKFEQDIILRENPPAPEKFGLNPHTTYLQVLTEFVEAPTPRKQTRKAGDLTDESLHFGAMHIGVGKAFSVGDEKKFGEQVLVAKKWGLIEGRTFLVEEVPYKSVTREIQKLPAAKKYRGASLQRRGQGENTLAGLKALFPPKYEKKAISPSNKPARMAKATSKIESGFVMDYVILSSQTDFTFNAGKTYYVSDTVWLDGTSLIEGGAVIKYSASSIIFDGTVTSKASNGLPTIFTSKDDDSVGATIDGSSGIPTMQADPAIYFHYVNAFDLKNFRISHAMTGIYMSLYAAEHKFSDFQFLNCGVAVYAPGSGETLLKFHNSLFREISNCFLGYGNTTWELQNTTICEVNQLVDFGEYEWLTLTNCLLVNINNWAYHDQGNFFTNSSVITNSQDVFVASATGVNYLAVNSPYRNIGTTNIDATLLAELQKKTTFPPVTLSDLDITNDVTLSPQNLGDTDVPDLGYHSDSIDYLIAGVSVSEAAVKVYPGTVIAFCGTTNRPFGLNLGSDAKVICKGLATNWNKIIVGSSFDATGYVSPVRGLFTDSNGNLASLLDCRFTQWSLLSPYISHLAISNRISVILRDCQFFGGSMFLNYESQPSLLDAEQPLLAADPAINNCLIDGVNILLRVDDGSPTYVQNNLFIGGVFNFLPLNTEAIVQNNFFNQTVIPDNSAAIALYFGGFNAFLTDYDRLQPTNANDLILTTPIAFQAGPLGNYYQPSGSLLLNAGSTNAAALGLYDYTVRSNFVSGAQIKETNSVVDIGYHYVAVDTNGAPISTYTNGLPDYLVTSSTGEIPDWWLWHYLGHLSFATNADFDADGTNILAEFQNGVDPNKISFAFAVPNQYVSTNIVTGSITVWSGAPSKMAVLVDTNNFTTATWTAFTSSVTLNLGASDGPHTVWIGLRGLPDDAQPTWQETTLVLDTTAPTIGISTPTNNSSFGVSRVNVRGTFVAAGLKQITVNGVLAFTSGLDFDALNVPLEPGTNFITAIIECLNGRTNAAAITIVANTNSVGELVDPVQLTADPVGGFTPLPVTFTVQTNLPGTISQVLYDWNGDDVIDLVTNSLTAVSHTYTNGEYFPVATIETSAGWFSSSGGWNSPYPNRLRINVQAAVQVLATINITDPVDLQWTVNSNLYVLSGSAAAVYEFDANRNTNRFLSGLGANPSGLGVDGNGNVYVAVTASNQVWKLNPTETAFEVDTNFGIGGCIGLTNGASGTNNGEFNAPFDVAVSPDGTEISVSDSGNHRIQQFSAAGVFLNTFGTQGTNTAELDVPKGLTYTSSGQLCIVDSGNDRVVVTSGITVLGTSGTEGDALGEFQGAVNAGVGTRGIYVAEVGNDRVQVFEPLRNLNGLPPTPFIPRLELSGQFSPALNHPRAVAPIWNLLAEQMYIADTGNDRVLKITLPENSVPDAAWTTLITNLITNDDIAASVAKFSRASQDSYYEAFLHIGLTKAKADLGGIGTLTPVYIGSDEAQYYFERVIGGQTMLFPVDFVKENGEWKIQGF